MTAYDGRRRTSYDVGVLISETILEANPAADVRVGPLRAEQAGYSTTLTVTVGGVGHRVVATYTDATPAHAARIEYEVAA